ILAHPVPAAPGVAEDALFLQIRQDLLGAGHVDAEGFVTGEGKLKGRALNMTHEDHQIVRVDERMLRRAAEKVVGVFGDVLVQRRARRDQNGSRHSLAPPGPPRLLPRARDRAGKARHNARLELTDVDAELERVRAHYPEHVAVAQSPLDLPALQGKVPAPIAPNLPGPA